MNEIIEELEQIGTELFSKYGTDSYAIRCQLHDTKEKLKSLNIGSVMHMLPDLKSKSLTLFLEEYKNLASKDVLTKVWEYGNNQWENGYSQGKYNPDFD